MIKIDFDDMMQSSLNKQDKPVSVGHTDKSVVIDEKCFHAGRLFGAISNGNAVLPFDFGKALKFIAHPSSDPKKKFVTIQILDAGCGKQVKSQQWNRTKTVTKKVEVARKSRVKKEDLIVDTEVKQKNIFDLNG